MDIRESTQLDLFRPTLNLDAKTRLQAAVDKLEGKARWGSMGFAEEWKPRSEFKSNRWTTEISELPVVRA